MASATTLTVTIPVPPSGLSATKVGKNKIKLTWTDNSNNESGFRLLESLDGRTWKQLANVPANTLGYTDVVMRGVRYCYCVAAFNSAGCSGFTAAVKGLSKSCWRSMGRQRSGTPSAVCHFSALSAVVWGAAINIFESHRAIRGIR